MSHVAKLAALLVCIAAPAFAQSADPLAGLDFLVGTWTADAPAAKDAPNRGGSSTIARDLGGTVLLRRDRVLLKDGGTLEIAMTIYPEAGKLRADFFDSEKHVIHYGVTTLEPGKFVQFTSDSPDAAPAFRLSYDKASTSSLRVRFEIAPPGVPRAFKTYSEGTMAKR